MAKNSNTADNNKAEEAEEAEGMVEKKEAEEVEKKEPEAEGMVEEAEETVETDVVEEDEIEKKLEEVKDVQIEPTVRFVVCNSVSAVVVIQNVPQIYQLYYSIPEIYSNTLHVQSYGHIYN